MFPLCLLAKIEVYIINDNKNIYVIGVDKRIMFLLCHLAKIEVYIINHNKNIYFIGVEAKINV